MMNLGAPLPDGIEEDVRLTVSTPDGDVLSVSLIYAAQLARTRDGELLPFLYRVPIDPENPDAPRPLRRARLAITDDEEIGP